MGKHRIRRELVDKPLNEIHPYEHNPRKNDSAVGPLARSIAANGFNVPITIDENGVIEKVMPKVKPDTNAAEILAYLDGEEV